MVNDEIVGGLKSALERGYSLEKAMLTFFNSGYKREEIEEAARGLLEFKPESQMQPPIKTTPRFAEIKPTPQILTTPTRARAFPELQPEIMQRPMPIQIKKPIMPQQPIQLQRPLEIQQPIQKISSYGEVKQKEKIKAPKRDSKEKGVIIVLVFLLIFLMGALGMIFVFRQQLIDFLSSLFG